MVHVVIHVFQIVSPGSDLDGEDFEIDDVDVHAARARAVRRIKETFALASDDRKAITTFRYVGTRARRKQVAL